MSRILRGSKDFDPDCITFSKIKKLNSSSFQKVIYPLYDNNIGKIYIQTCKKMYIPFGLKLSDKYSKYSLDISFPSYDVEETEMNLFYKNMVKLDEKIIIDAKKNVIEWFGMEKTDKELKKIYFPIIKKNNKFAPRMKVKLPYSNGKFLCDFYSNSREKIDFQKESIDSFLSKGNKIRLLLQFVGIWITERGFGSSWKVIQGEVDKALFENYCFLEDSDKSDCILEWEKI